MFLSNSHRRCKMPVVGSLCQRGTSINAGSNRSSHIFSAQVKCLLISSTGASECNSSTRTSFNNNNHNERIHIIIQAKRNKFVQMFYMMPFFYQSTDFVSLQSSNVSNFIVNNSNIKCTYFIFLQNNNDAFVASFIFFI